ncbi:unnamed protein product, partial [Cyprideis torosa]
MGRPMLALKMVGDGVAPSNGETHRMVGDGVAPSNGETHRMVGDGVAPSNGETHRMVNQDYSYFGLVEKGNSRIGVVLAESLTEVVDSMQRNGVIKFMLVCYGSPHTSLMISIPQEPSSVLLTVYVEDLNDHAPVFLNSPYVANVDELTPPGIAILSGIVAMDQDKANTANSDIAYSLTRGNRGNTFELRSGGETEGVSLVLRRSLDFDKGDSQFLLEVTAKVSVKSAFDIAYSLTRGNRGNTFELRSGGETEGVSLVLRRSLDFDKGDSQFLLEVTAKDHGDPPLSSRASIRVHVIDNDDLDPVFSANSYRAKIWESIGPATDKVVRHAIETEPEIMAWDGDRGMNKSLRFRIVSGNERGFFDMDPASGRLFLVKEVDRENPLTSHFSLQISASQVDKEDRRALAL